MLPAAPTSTAPRLRPARSALVAAGATALVVTGVLTASPATAAVPATGSHGGDSRHSGGHDRGDSWSWDGHRRDGDGWSWRGHRDGSDRDGRHDGWDERDADDAGADETVTRRGGREYHEDADGHGHWAGDCPRGHEAPTPTPSPSGGTPAPAPTPTPTPTPEPTPTPAPTPRETPAPSPTATASPSPSPTPTEDVLEEESPTPSPTQTQAPVSRVLASGGTSAELAETGSSGAAPVAIGAAGAVAAGAVLLIVSRRRVRPTEAAAER